MSAPFLTVTPQNSSSKARMSLHLRPRTMSFESLTTSGTMVLRCPLYYSIASPLDCNGSDLEFGLRHPAACIRAAPIRDEDSYHQSLYYHQKANIFLHLQHLLSPSASLHDTPIPFTASYFHVRHLTRLFRCISTRSSLNI